MTDIQTKVQQMQALEQEIAAGEGPAIKSLCAKVVTDESIEAATDVMQNSRPNSDVYRAASNLINCLNMVKQVSQLRNPTEVDAGAAITLE